MAAAAPYPPWVKENPDQQDFVKRSPKYSEMLKKNTADLCTTVVIAGLWIYLITLDVINSSVKARLQSHATNEDQVAALLDYLLTGPCWRLHAFLKALCMDDQAAIVSQILLLNPDDYVWDQEDQDLTAQRKQLKTEIHSHRSVYNRTLMQGSLFDIPSLDLPYNMELCYIQILANLDERLTNAVLVAWHDILKPKLGNFARLKTALLSGPAGAGKSSFIKFYAYKWSQQADGSSDWDLIVILNLSKLRLTPGRSPKEHIKEAIQQSLKGRGDKEAIMKSLDNPNLNILIIPDGMEDCHSPTVLEMLQELVSSCYWGILSFTVLCTVRSGLSPIRDGLFDRRMKLDGFKSHEGVRYVKRFYETIQKPEDDSILDYIVKSKHEFDHILTNPHCTHILSVVTSDGTLKLVKGLLKLKEVFQAMEKTMRRRQLEKMLGEGPRDGVHDYEMQIKISHFYNMCLWTLLKDVRTFTDEILSLFEIDEQHPYMTFMKKTKKYNSDLENISHWNFSHDMFHEYFAASALEALPTELLSFLLLTVSSMEKFRNLQRILFSSLGGDADKVDVMSDMIRVTLITQGNCEMLDDTTMELVNEVKEKTKTDISMNSLLDTLIPGKDHATNKAITSGEDVWTTAKTLYADRAEFLQNHGLFCHMVTHHDDLTQHIYNCLYELPEHHQQLVFEQSLGHTMPSLQKNARGRREILYNTGGVRWSWVTEQYDGFQLDINYSLTDAAEAVHKYGQNHLRTRMGKKNHREFDTILLTVCSRRDGGRPYVTDDQFLSTDQWSKVLTALSDLPITATKLRVEFDANLSHGGQGFLQCLMRESSEASLRKLLVKGRMSRRKIEVFNANIDRDSLSSWKQWYDQQNLLNVQRDKRH